jgi:phosphoglycolate phosphatase-like HAD superfamily hydrolase
MPQVEAVICDYNGTISADRDCGRLWKSVGMAELMRGRVGLLPAMFKLKALSKAYKRGEIGYDRIYEAFNEEVLSKTPYERVREHIEKFAAKVAIEGRYDKDLLNAAEDLHGRGVKTGILSTGCEDEIQTFLELTTHNVHFDLIRANKLYRDLTDDTCRFLLSIYQNKGEKLDAMLREMGVTGGVAYVGDTAEDYPCFEHDSVTKKIVPPFADEAVKEEASKRFGAIVLAIGEELEAALK